MIELRKARKRFGQRLAVDEVSLEVPRGEIFGLLGHNGAGKSTAIGMMLGQVWPTSGDVKVCGHDVTTQRARALQKVGAWVGLTVRVDSKVRTYSHGMRARLALAQALLPHPELLILDEPGSGLDPEGIAEMRQTIGRLHRELGLTILLSSHLLNEVEQLCTRIAVLQQGRKVFEGQVTEIRAARSRVALKTPNFAVAVRLLRERGLVTDSSENRFLSLKDGCSTTEITRVLVEADIPVEGIWQHEQTLEDFYLSLVKAPSSTPPVN
ncbi:MAG: ABC transporter ATP-binding protein [Verrucomicrobia bacterium]|nr:ABC transporter ATP-binding protein [Verrucomicrobiota bacterium]